MQPHPFFNSIKHKSIITILIILFVIIQCGLLIWYTKLSFIAAFTESLLSIGAFVCLGYFLWYAVEFIRFFQGEILYLTAAIIIWISFNVLGVHINELWGEKHFYSMMYLLPFYVVIGFLCLFSLVQWYKLERLSNWKEDVIATQQVKSMEQTEQLSDRIAVKDGTRINVIPLTDILYVQANKDYIVLVSNKGQYLKEQTMKSLEQQLPPSQFIRVHRSFIVNVEQINRVELYGKESYRILLKNGDTIKASQTGYKLLKEYLSI